MKKKKEIVFLVAGSLLLFPGLARTSRAAATDEISRLREQLEAQQQLIQQMQERLDQLEARQKIKEKSLTQRIEQVAETAEKKSTALPDSLKWAEKVKISGDFRYRHEHIDQERSSGSVGWRNGRDRHRFRARLMLAAMLSDQLGLNFRLASGSGDPVSTNQTLEDSFSSKDIWLDLAYFDWHPASIKGLNVYGGKMKNPFYNVGKNQLIWDSDLNPEGIAAQYAMPLNSRDQIFINGGGFWVDESSGGVDTSLLGVQGYLKHTLGNPDYILGGVSYYDYGNIQGRGDLKSTWSTSSSFFGNTTAGSLFASDYDIFEAFGEYGTKCFGLPTAFYGNCVKNLVASTDQDTGWLIGGRLNKAKDPGSWEFSYDYRDLQADAVLGAFSDSDFIGGGTDGKGHRLGFKYQLHKNVQAALTYFHNDKRQSPDCDYRRLMADLVFKF